MKEISETELIEITAGDSVSWKKYLPDYLPSAGWSLSYSLRLSSAAGTKLTLSTTADGLFHVVGVSASASASWTSGEYQWQSYVTKSPDRHQVGSGRITILPNFASSAVFDPRSQVKRTLDAINSLLEGKPNRDAHQIRIGDEQITKMTPDELIKWRNVYRSDYQAEIAKENLALGKPTKNVIKVYL